MSVTATTFEDGLTALRTLFHSVNKERDELTVKLTAVQDVINNWNIRYRHMPDVQKLMFNELKEALAEIRKS